MSWSVARFLRNSQISCDGCRRRRYSASRCRVCSWRVVRHRNRKRVRRQCHGGVWAGRRHHSQLPARRTGQVIDFCQDLVTSTIRLRYEIRESYDKELRC